MSELLDPDTQTASPLDPLSVVEITSAVAAVKASPEFRALSSRTRFVTVDLREPEKSNLLAFQAGVAELPAREAEMVVLDHGDGSTHEIMVLLTPAGAGRVLTWNRRTDVQPMALVGELMEAEAAVLASQEFQQALALRGVTDFAAVQVDAWPGGNFGYPEEQGRRIARCIAFIRPQPQDNDWARPVDGLLALVDLNSLEILRIDDTGVVPIPHESGNFDTTAVEKYRDDIRPLHITQPEGASFSVNNRIVNWQKWRFHVGFTSREGLVLNQISYEDQGRQRSILHRVSLSEMIVPYGDPSPTHYFKNAIDAGENGVGVSASSLVLGCDCVGEIHYFDAVVADADGSAVSIPNAICMHEEDAGVLWRHIEWRTGVGEVRRSRRLVISSFSAIGNYDYGFFWYLYQDGTITFEVKLTGVLSTGAIPLGKKPLHGTLVAPGLNAMIHQHFFNMRLDFDVDGQENAVEEVWTESVPRGPENPHGNAFRSLRRRLTSELDARRKVDSASARWWEIINPRSLHRLGNPVAYRLTPGENTLSFAQPDAAVSLRAGFIREHLWVTPYDRSERYAAGDYPNQHAGGAGLPEWTAADRSIVDRDIVVWYTFGHHHVPRPEDWPVMPVVTSGFSLRPAGFFERNPALDVPPSVAQANHCAGPQ
ncbi:MAG: primary-amine oxidase [Actinomycetes bacterium]